MSIIINEKNRTQIGAALAEAEGRATARILSFEDLQEFAETLELRLEGIPLAARKGATAVVFDGQAVPGSYGYRAESTYATLERRATGWALVSACRDWAPSKSGGGYVDAIRSVEITEEQRDLLIAAVLRGHKIEVQS